MALKQEDFNRIAQHLKKYWGDRYNCPQCKAPTANGEAQGYVTVVFGDAPGALLLTGNGAAYVVVACTNCGFAQFIDAKRVEGLSIG